MIVEINGVEGRLYWEYDRVDADMKPFEHEHTFARFCPFDQAFPELEAYATCVPSDKFVKETGRKISLARLLHLMGVPRQERAKVWEKYHNRRNGNGR